MADGDPIGEAKVRIVPDTSGFADELRAEIDEATADQGQNIDVKVGVDDAEAVANLGDFDRRLDEVGAKRPTVTVSVDNGDFDVKLDEDKAKLDELSAKHVDIRVGINESDMGRLESDTGNVSRDLENMGRDATSAAGSMGGMGSAAGEAGGGIGSMGYAAAAAVPLVASLGSVAVASLASLPGMIAGAGEALGTLKLGLAGIGTVLAPIQNVFSAVTPAVFEFGSMINSVLVPALQSVQGGIQAIMLPQFTQAFDQLIGPITSVLDSLLPMANTLGQLAIQFSSFLSSTQGMSELNTILQEGNQFMQQFGSAAITFMQSFMSMGAQAGPFLQTLGQGVQQLANAFVQFGNSPAFKQILADAIQALPQIIGLFNNLWNVVSQLIVDFAPIGTAMMQAFNMMLPPINEILKALQPLMPVIAQLVVIIGQALAQAIKSFVPMVQPLVSIFISVFDAVKPLLPVLLNMAIQAINPLGQAASLLTPILNGVATAMKAIEPVLQAVASFMAGAMTTATHALGDAISWLGNNVFHPIWTGIQTVVSDVWHNVLDPIWNGAIKPAINDIGTGLQWLGNNVFEPIWNGIKTVVKGAWDDVLSPIWNGAIKPALDIIKSAVNDVGSAFSWVFGGIESVVQAAWGVIKPIFDLIIGAFNTVMSLGQKVGSALGFNNTSTIDADTGMITGPDGKPMPVGLSTGAAQGAGMGPNPNIAGHAFGGPVRAGETSWVGERGRELYIPGLRFMADGGDIVPGVPTMVGENGPELRTFSQPGGIVPNNQLGAATGANPGASQVTGWQQTASQSQAIWQQMQAQYLTHNTEMMATTQNYGAQQVTANQNVWTQVHTNAQTVWQQMQTQYLTSNGLNLANTQTYGAQTVAQNQVTWGQVRDQSQTIWQQMFTQYTGTNALSLANTQTYGAQTLSTLNTTWTQVRDQSQATWQQMTATLQTENATQLADVTTSSNAAKDATLTAYQGLATALPGVVNGIWSNTDNAYKGGIDNTIGDLDQFLSGVNTVGAEVGWAVSLNVPKLARGGRFDQATAIVGEGDASEYVIPTDPAYHDNAAKLQAQMFKETGGRLGVPGFDAGGVVPPAVADAESFLGTPYVFGGASRAGTDCSGLIYQIAQMLGIPLPRTSQAQFAAGPPVPGGLGAGGMGMPIFFNTGSPDAQPDHVGLYMGGGSMIDAPHSGAVVNQEGIAGFGSVMGLTNPFGASAINLPVWNNLATPDTLAGEAPAVANKLAQAVSTFLAAQQQAYVAKLAAQSQALGGADQSGAGAGGPGGMSAAAIEALWIQAGGPPGAAANMAGIAQAESGDNPNAVQQGEPPGLTGWGLWQITPTSGIPGGAYLLDPLTNAQKAVQLFNAGGYAPWRGDPYASSHGLAAGGTIPIRSFDTGGLLAPGMTLAVNNTGSPEQVVGPGGGAMVEIGQLVVQGGQGTTGEIRMAVSTGISDALSRLEQEYQAT